MSGDTYGSRRFLAAVAPLPIDRTSWLPQSEDWVLDPLSETPTRGLGYDSCALWNLHGIAWNEAEAPRRIHTHTVQTYGVIALEQVFRCPCGAIGDNIGRRWSTARSPRVRPSVVARLKAAVSR